MNTATKDKLFQESFMQDLDDKISYSWHTDVLGSMLSDWDAQKQSITEFQQTTINGWKKSNHHLLMVMIAKRS